MASSDSENDWESVGGVGTPLHDPQEPFEAATPDLEPLALPGAAMSLEKQRSLRDDLALAPFKSRGADETAAAPYRASRLVKMDSGSNLGASEDDDCSFVPISLVESSMASKVSSKSSQVESLGPPAWLSSIATANGSDMEIAVDRLFDDLVEGQMFSEKVSERAFPVIRRPRELKTILFDVFMQLESSPELQERILDRLIDLSQRSTTSLNYCIQEKVLEKCVNAVFCSRNSETHEWDLDRMPPRLRKKVLEFLVILGSHSFSYRALFRLYHPFRRWRSLTTAKKRKGVQALILARAVLEATVKLKRPREYLELNGEGRIWTLNSIEMPSSGLTFSTWVKVRNVSERSQQSEKRSARPPSWAFEDSEVDSSSPYSTDGILLSVRHPETGDGFEIRLSTPENMAIGTRDAARRDLTVYTFQNSRNEVYSSATAPGIDFSGIENPGKTEWHWLCVCMSPPGHLWGKAAVRLSLNGTHLCEIDLKWPDWSNVSEEFQAVLGSSAVANRKPEKGVRILLARALLLKRFLGDKEVVSLCELHTRRHGLYLLKAAVLNASDPAVILRTRTCFSMKQSVEAGDLSLPEEVYDIFVESPFFNSIREWDTLRSQILPRGKAFERWDMLPQSIFEDIIFAWDAKHVRMSSEDSEQVVVCHDSGPESLHGRFEAHCVRITHRRTLTDTLRSVGGIETLFPLLVDSVLRNSDNEEFDSVKSAMTSRIVALLGDLISYELCEGLAYHRAGHFWRIQNRDLLKGLSFLLCSCDARILTDELVGSLASLLNCACILKELTQRARRASWFSKGDGDVNGGLVDDLELAKTKPRGSVSDASEEKDPTDANSTSTWPSHSNLRDEPRSLLQSAEAFLVDTVKLLFNFQIWASAPIQVQRRAFTIMFHHLETHYAFIQSVVSVTDVLDAVRLNYYDEAGDGEEVYHRRCLSGALLTREDLIECRYALFGIVHVLVTGSRPAEKSNFFRLAPSVFVRKDTKLIGEVDIRAIVAFAEDCAHCNKFTTCKQILEWIISAGSQSSDLVEILERTSSFLCLWSLARHKEIAPMLVRLAHFYAARSKSNVTFDMFHNGREDGANLFLFRRSPSTISPRSSQQQSFFNEEKATFLSATLEQSELTLDTANELVKFADFEGLLAHPLALKILFSLFRLESNTSVMEIVIPQVARFFTGRRGNTVCEAFGLIEGWAVDLVEIYSRTKDASCFDIITAVGSSSIFGSPSLSVSELLATIAPRPHADEELRLDLLIRFAREFLDRARLAVSNSGLDEDSGFFDKIPELTVDFLNLTVFETMHCGGGLPRRVGNSAPEDLAIQLFQFYVADVVMLVPRGFIERRRLWAAWQSTPNAAVAVRRSQAKTTLLDSGLISQDLQKDLADFEMGRFDCLKCEGNDESMSRERKTINPDHHAILPKTELFWHLIGLLHFRIEECLRAKQDATEHIRLIWSSLEALGVLDPGASLNLPFRRRRSTIGSPGIRSGRTPSPGSCFSSLSQHVSSYESPFLVPASSSPSNLTKMPSLELPPKQSFESPGDNFNVSNSGGSASASGDNSNSNRQRMASFTSDTFVLVEEPDLQLSKADLDRLMLLFIAACKWLDSVDKSRVDLVGAIELCVKKFASEISSSDIVFPADLARLARCDWLINFDAVPKAWKRSPFLADLRQIVLREVVLDDNFATLAQIASSEIQQRRIRGHLLNVHKSAAKMRAHVRTLQLNQFEEDARKLSQLRSLQEQRVEDALQWESLLREARNTSLEGFRCFERDSEEAQVWELDERETPPRMRIRMIPTEKKWEEGLHYIRRSTSSPNRRDDDVVSKTEEAIQTISDTLSRAVGRSSDVTVNSAAADWDVVELTSVHYSARNEKVVHSTACELVLPMCIIRGRLDVTTEHLYFYGDTLATPGTEHSDLDEDSNEQLSRRRSMNLMEDCQSVNLLRGIWAGDGVDPRTKASLSMKAFRNRRWPLSDLVDAHRRRHLLRPSALELFFADRRNFMLNFQNPLESMNVLSKIISLDPPLLLRNGAWAALTQKVSSKQSTRLSSQKQEEWTDRWVNWEISTFEYLMHLNTAAGRTYNDLTQYPVFPWVLQDFTSSSIDLENVTCYRDLSKPIGALETTRLHRFRKKWESFEPMTNEKPYLYGSHYSSAATVLFYLVRIEPFTTYARELQGGKFDHADRLFHSISETWQNCLNSDWDLKELTPEWFYFPDFLCNDGRQDLGQRQDGTELDDVKLPPWAAESAEKFIRVHREALEGDIVSSSIHQWIDLVFGFKQRGEEALKADNLFHYASYEDGVDLESISDPVMRNSLETMIAYFGQTPAQLFSRPHPKRKPRPRAKCPTPAVVLSQRIELSDHQNEPPVFVNSKEGPRAAKLERLWKAASRESGPKVTDGLSRSTSCPPLDTQSPDGQGQSIAFSPSSVSSEGATMDTAKVPMLSSEGIVHESGGVRPLMATIGDRMKETTSSLTMLSMEDSRFLVWPSRGYSSIIKCNIGQQIVLNENPTGTVLQHPRPTQDTREILAKYYSYFKSNPSPRNSAIGLGNGLALATCEYVDNSISVHSILGGFHLQRVQAHSGSGAITCIAKDSSSSLLLAGCQDGTVLAWKLRHPDNIAQIVDGVVAEAERDSPNGTSGRLASGIRRRPRASSLSEANSDKPTSEPHHKKVKSLIKKESMTRVLLNRLKSAFRFHKKAYPRLVEDWKGPWRWLAGFHGTPVSCVTAQLDLDLIASSSLRDGKVNLFVASDGRFLRSIALGGQSEITFTSHLFITKDAFVICQVMKFESVASEEPRSIVLQKFSINGKILSSKSLSQPIISLHLFDDNKFCAVFTSTSAYVLDLHSLQEELLIYHVNQDGDGVSILSGELSRDNMAISLAVSDGSLRWFFLADSFLSPFAD